MQLLSQLLAICDVTVRGFLAENIAQQTDFLKRDKICMPHSTYVNVNLYSIAQCLQCDWCTEYS